MLEGLGTLIEKPPMPYTRSLAGYGNMRARLAVPGGTEKETPTPLILGFSVSALIKALCLGVRASHLGFRD